VVRGIGLVRVEVAEHDDGRPGGDVGLSARGPEVAYPVHYRIGLFLPCGHPFPRLEVRANHVEVRPAERRRQIEQRSRMRARRVRETERRLALASRQRQVEAGDDDVVTKSVRRPAPALCERQHTVEQLRDVGRRRRFPRDRRRGDLLLPAPSSLTGDAIINTRKENGETGRIAYVRHTCQNVIGEAGTRHETDWIALAEPVVPSVSGGIIRTRTANIESACLHSLQARTRAAASAL
jgi:hypothetical protein